MAEFKIDDFLIPVCRAVPAWALRGAAVRRRAESACSQQTKSALCKT